MQTPFTRKAVVRAALVAGVLGIVSIWAGAQAPARPSPVSGPGVTLEDGLKYWDLQVGTGKEAKAGRKIKVHYTGWLLEGGSKFDSSLDRGRPFEFTLGKGIVIRGWDEGVEGMKVGGKRQLRIPPSLGYGMQGAPPAIPPDSYLIFDVELLSVK